MVKATCGATRRRAAGRARAPRARARRAARRGGRAVRRAPTRTGAGRRRAPATDGSARGASIRSRTCRIGLGWASQKRDTAARVEERDSSRTTLTSSTIASATTAGQRPLQDAPVGVDISSSASPTPASTSVRGSSRWTPPLGVMTRARISGRAWCHGRPAPLDPRPAPGGLARERAVEEPVGIGRGAALVVDEGPLLQEDVDRRALRRGQGAGRGEHRLRVAGERLVAPGLDAGCALRCGDGDEGEEREREAWGGHGGGYFDGEGTSAPWVLARRRVSPGKGGAGLVAAGAGRRTPLAGCHVGVIRCGRRSPNAPCIALQPGRRRRRGVRRRCLDLLQGPALRRDSRRRGGGAGRPRASDRAAHHLDDRHGVRGRRRAAARRGERAGRRPPRLLARAAPRDARPRAARSGDPRRLPRPRAPADRARRGALRDPLPAQGRDGLPRAGRASTRRSTRGAATSRRSPATSPTRSWPRRRCARARAGSGRSSTARASASSSPAPTAASSRRTRRSAS